MICCVCSERKQKTKKNGFQLCLAPRSAKLEYLARENSNLPSFAERQARGSRQRFFKKKNKFFLFAERVVGGARQRIFFKKN